MPTYLFKFSRMQNVCIKLKREPTTEEKQVLMGMNDDDENMFSLPEDLIDFDDEEIIEEDYSSNVHTFRPIPTIEEIESVVENGNNAVLKCRCEMPAKMHGKDICWRCKRSLS